MNDQNRILTCALTFALFLLAGRFSFAQAPPENIPGSFKITAIHQQLVIPPDFKAFVTGSGTRASTLSKKWLEIETDFTSDPDWADDVMLKYYVLIGRGRDTKLFVGEMTYVNVAKGNRHLSAMYMHPNTVERYGRGQVEAVAVQLFYKGQLIDQASSPASRERWWERYTPQTGYLLNPQQTPWSVVAYERYESLKPAQ
jgi:hypothetical protein